LWPREHGAYFQLLAPLLTALLIVRPSWQGVLLAVAAFCAFVANEPLLVVLGHRGKRMRENAGARALKLLVFLGLTAALAGGIALVFSPPTVLEVAGVVALPALATIVLAWKRAERSVLGECVAAITLSGASAPVLVAGGASWQSAMALWAAWSFGYACTVMATHRVIARHRARASWPDAVAGLLIAGISITAIVLLVHAAGASYAIAGAAAPLALSSLVLVIRPPRATYLRAIGIAFVCASLATGGLAFATL